MIQMRVRSSLSATAIRQSRAASRRGSRAIRRVDRPKSLNKRAIVQRVLTERQRLNNQAER